MHQDNPKILRLNGDKICSFCMIISFVLILCSVMMKTLIESCLFEIDFDWLRDVNYTNNVD
jgi:hypothetical protein